MLTMFKVSGVYVGNVNGGTPVLFYGALVILVILNFLIATSLFLKFFCDKGSVFLIPCGLAFIGGGILIEASLGTYSEALLLPVAESIQYNDFLIYHFFRNILLILMFAVSLIMYKIKRARVYNGIWIKIIVSVAIVLALVVICLAWLYSSNFHQLNLRFLNTETYELLPSWQTWVNSIMTACWILLFFALIKITRLSNFIWVMLGFYCLCSVFSVLTLTSASDMGNSIWYQIYLVEVLNCVVCLVFIFLNACCVYMVSHSNYNEAYQNSVKDYLTQVYNRRYFFQQLSVLLPNVSRGNPLTLIVCDIDFFKSINDRYGHHQGDIVIQYISWVLQDTIRKDDLVARLGGEEFAILLPGQSQQNALIIANRIKHRIDYDLRVKKKEGVNEPVTVSMGIYSLTEENLNEIDFVERADQALYQAKNDGRNCIRVWSKN
jgi:diguanylate cyclase (GGDEF)-like protein